jgi:hypothetical protein
MLGLFVFQSLKISAESGLNISSFFRKLEMLKNNPDKSCKSCPKKVFN